MIVRLRTHGSSAFALLLVTATALTWAPVSVAAAEQITIGSKAFPESWILGEALAILARDSGATVRHRSNLGGTEIVFDGLRAGAIDVYPEYTGTIAEVIVKAKGRTDLDSLRHALAPSGIGVSAPLGFNDGYALAVRGVVAYRMHLRTLSDLARHPELKLGLTHEFLGRRDGFEGLARTYGLSRANVRGIQHELAYRALESGAIDVTDIYTTDAEIERLGLRVLEDDRRFFPRYDAVLLYRLALEREAPRAFAAMRALEGAIDERAMIRANGRVVLEKQGFDVAARELVADIQRRRSAGASGEPGEGGASGAGNGGPGADRLHDILRATGEHLTLVTLSLIAAILIGIPLGILATRSRLLAGVTLAVAGLLQTIPSLALLAFLIPVLGIGVNSALVALFLYSLLPIVRNTYVGLTGIAPALEESARALALRPATHLFRVQLPLASPSIMAGIKISAVIDVGTATLAALIGAGGLGEPILSGIQLRRPDLILQGAVPAAVLALLVQWLFDLLDRWVVPAGLRTHAERSE